MDLSTFFSNFLKIFIITTPASAIPVLIALTPGQTVRQRIGVAAGACSIAAGVLCLFALTGNLLFNFFGISLQAFKIAGGIYLIIVSRMLIFGNDGHETAKQEAQNVSKQQSVAITPLGIPIICGPGMISTVLLLGGNLQSIGGRLALSLDVILALFCLYLILWFSAKYASKIRPFFLKLAEKLTGIFVAALGLLILFNGIGVFLEKGTAL